ncbi:MAG TPA: hypothetical protein VGC32_21115 [Solirubrobacterales bacterium]
MLAAVLPAIKRTADWKARCESASRSCAASSPPEPAFASLRCVDGYGAGPQAVGTTPGR